MTKQFTEALITTILFSLAIYGLFLLMGHMMDHCEQATSNYDDYRFCLGI